jgi:NitT/TauT family transport system permease protein
VAAETIPETRQTTGCKMATVEDNTIKNIEQSGPKGSAVRPSRLPAWRIVTARRVAVAVFLLVILAGWQIYSSFVPPVLTPSPARVAGRFVTMWSNPGFLTYAGATVFHVLVSVALAFIL